MELVDTMFRRKSNVVFIEENRSSSEKSKQIGKIGYFGMNERPKRKFRNSGRKKF